MSDPEEEALDLIVPLSPSLGLNRSQAGASDSSNKLHSFSTAMASAAVALCCICLALRESIPTLLKWLSMMRMRSAVCPAHKSLGKAELLVSPSYFDASETMCPFRTLAKASPAGAALRTASSKS